MPQSYTELDEIKEIWDIVRESFCDILPTQSISLWFGDIEVTGYDVGVVHMAMKSVFRCKTVKKNYLEEMKIRFSEQLGFDVDIDLVCTGTPVNKEQMIRDIISRAPRDPRDYARREAEEKEAQKEREKEEVKKKEEKVAIGSTLPPFNFEYTFENFIVGSSNKFAHAACVAVARLPAKDYNPLFIYGPSGIGKTHLLYAITNHIREKNPNVKVIYIKGEDFTNQMIDSLSRQAMHEFREKYRDCDVLLIDDIQFIAGKISTQEEFFHTFNALYENHKQIILTSDRPPREIKTLEDRLKGRFEWGLIADIQPPDLELRIAIIKKKAEQVNILLSEDVLTFLAENLRSNIRQIEGAIKKLSAQSIFECRPIDMNIARGCIAELLGGAEPVSVTVDKIFMSIYQRYNVKKEDLLSAKRSKEIAYARHICIYLIREVTEMSLSNIGDIFNRDHTTIMNSISKIETGIISDPMLAYEVDDIKKEVTPNI